MESCIMWPFEISFSFSLSITLFESIQVVSVVCSFLLRSCIPSYVNDLLKTEAATSVFRWGFPITLRPKSALLAPKVSPPGLVAAFSLLLPCPPPHTLASVLLKPAQLVSLCCSAWTTSPTSPCPPGPYLSVTSSEGPSWTFLYECCHPPLSPLISSLALIIITNNFLSFFT